MERSGTIGNLSGKGRRPVDPYVRILWASKRGQGCTLSADEVHLMSLDDAIEVHAINVVMDRPDGWLDD